MKQKSTVKKSQSVREIPTKINYGGERSPHWDFVNDSQHMNDDGTPAEHVRANPDVLSEEDSMYNRPLSPEGQAQLETIQDILVTLPAQQRRVVELCAIEGLTLKKAAKQLGLSIPTVQGYLNRARTKIKAAHKHYKDS